MRRRWRAAPALLALLLTQEAGAAGGHFEVDDATVLAPGRCQVEAWGVRATRPSPGEILHFGPACRVGAVELGLNVDQIRDVGGVIRTVGPAIKWVVDPLLPRLSAGLAYSLAVGLDGGGRPVHMLYVPLTLFPSERIQMHANVGLDIVEGRRLHRAGLAAEWTVDDRWTLLAERIRRIGDTVSRVGARRMLTDAVGLDLSLGRSSATGARVATVGLNWEFDR